MAELISARFRDLVTRLYREPPTQGTLFELPYRNWFRPEPDGPDLSIDHHGLRAGNPSGPAAGPHTQMAQNILLSYVAGGRVLELKTVQADRRFTTPRPCINVANPGIGMAWLQELSIAEALREYVAGAMLIELFRRSHEHAASRLDGLAGAVVYDMSVGYDLAGIRCDMLRRFLDGMRSAGELIDRLRAEIPREFPAARDHGFATRLSDSVTLSTFPGCPADKLEQICELLIAEHDLNVSVKVDPWLLGEEQIQHLLYDLLGYTQVRLDPQPHAGEPTLDQAVELCGRLTDFGQQHGRRVGFKFCNVLPVRSQSDDFSPGSQAAHLSGPGLHVIALTLADEFRKKVGPLVPVSFSGGIDRHNFPLAVACGFVPVSACTDLLRPGGYGRLVGYLQTLTQEMHKLDAVNIDEFVLRCFEQEPEARRRAAADLSETAGADELRAAAVRWAGLLNTSIVAQMARRDGRYRAEKPRSAGRRIDSEDEASDSLMREAWIAVCPNAANFTYPTPVVSFNCCDALVAPDGSWQDVQTSDFTIGAEAQIARYADFCDECGNCEVFCPEQSAPFAAKPDFHSGVESWEKAAPRDGYVVHEQPEGGWIRARIGGQVYQLTYVNQTQQYVYDDGVVEAVLTGWGHQIVGVRVLRTLTADHRLNLWIYHLLRYLRQGVLDQRRVNPINVQWLCRTRAASGAPR